MQTIMSPTCRVDEDQRFVTEAMRPSATELVRARRQLHFKAIVIAALVIGSYWSLVLTTSSVVEKLLAAMVLVVALTATATRLRSQG